MRLRILLQKVGANFLQSVKAAMSVELGKIQVMVTYEQVLMTFHNEVNRNPPGCQIIIQGPERSMK